MKEFNITGTCIPHMHYMVDIREKLPRVVELIKKRKYFIINRPRQYGKTSMVYALEQELKEEYTIISISFEGLGEESFDNIESFAKTFHLLLEEVFESEQELLQCIHNYPPIQNFKEFSIFITTFIKKTDQKVILIIDEVDRASNFHLFNRFLGMLRDKYLKRNSGKDSTFHSVILVGLHDIKNLKVKMHSERSPNELQPIPSYNSPWNIATEFKVDMSFSPAEIATMLEQWRVENGEWQMDVALMSREIYKYTSGYPFLVSNICKLIDEELDRDWSVAGIQKAIDIISKEQNTLFDDLIKNLESDAELFDLLYSVLVEKEEVEYNIDNPVVQKGVMYGLFKEGEEKEAAIHNKIFEIRLLAYLISKQQTKGLSFNKYNYRKNFIDSNGNLEIEHVLLKFQEFVKDTYSGKNKKFYEKHGRLLLIAFIKPIINGSGFYYIEAQQSYERRSDMIITYNNKEYILELKLWYGEKYHREGLKQLAGYLESRSQSKGYLVVFNFNQNKEFRNGWNVVGGKEIFEVMV